MDKSEDDNRHKEFEESIDRYFDSYKGKDVFREDSTSFLEDGLKIRAICDDLGYDIRKSSVQLEIHAIANKAENSILEYLEENKDVHLKALELMTDKNLARNFRRSFLEKAIEEKLRKKDLPKRSKNIHNSRNNAYETLKNKIEHESRRLEAQSFSDEEYQNKKKQLDEFKKKAEDYISKKSDDDLKYLEDRLKICSMNKGLYEVLSLQAQWDKADEYLERQVGVKNFFSGILDRSKRLYTDEDFQLEELMFYQENIVPRLDEYDRDKIIESFARARDDPYPEE